jgi:hypothetical protein
MLSEYDGEDSLQNQIGTQIVKTMKKIKKLKKCFCVFDGRREVGMFCSEAIWIDLGLEDI